MNNIDNSGFDTFKPYHEEVEQKSVNASDNVDVRFNGTGVLASIPCTPNSPKQRVQDELKELLEKTSKLENFLYSEKIIEADLSQDMIRLLDCQLHAMYNYAAILQNRLAIWDRKDKGTFYHNFESRY